MSNAAREFRCRRAGVFVGCGATGGGARACWAERSRDVQVDYPAGEAQQLAFSDQPLHVYEGKTTLTVRFAAAQTGKDPIELAITYQACDESACLPPMTKQFTIAST